MFRPQTLWNPMIHTIYGYCLMLFGLDYPKFFSHFPYCCIISKDGHIHPSRFISFIAIRNNIGLITLPSAVPFSNSTLSDRGDLIWTCFILSYRKLLVQLNIHPSLFNLYNRPFLQTMFRHFPYQRNNQHTGFLHYPFKDIFAKVKELIKCISFLS